MNKLGKIKNSSTAFFLFLLCWIAYFTAYIGRLNYSSAMSDMIQTGILTQSHAGFISMLYFFSYGFGQLLNGILGDWLPPQKMIFTGLFLAAVMNFLMPLISLYPFMAAVWGINGYAQAMIWPPIIRIFSEMLDSRRKLKYSIDIVSSQASGTLGFLSPFCYHPSSVRMEICIYRCFHTSFYRCAGLESGFFRCMQTNRHRRQKYFRLFCIRKVTILGIDPNQWNLPAFIPYHDPWNVKRRSYHLGSHIHFREFSYFPFFFCTNYHITSYFQSCRRLSCKICIY